MRAFLDRPPARQDSDAGGLPPETFRFSFGTEGAAKPAIGRGYSLKVTFHRVDEILPGRQVGGVDDQGKHNSPLPAAAAQLHEVDAARRGIIRRPLNVHGIQIEAEGLSPYLLARVAHDLDEDGQMFLQNRLLRSKGI
jgi:hypothetical protein